MRYGLIWWELEIPPNLKSRPRGEGAREKTEPWCMVAGPSRVSHQYTLSSRKNGGFPETVRSPKVLQTNPVHESVQRIRRIASEQDCQVDPLVSNGPGDALLVTEQEGRMNTREEQHQVEIAGAACSTTKL